MGKQIAIWRTTDGIHYVELVRKDGRYLLHTSRGPRYLDAHDFDNDADAIWYVSRRVTEGSFDPPPLTWRRG
jgi:hypothetical protein